MQAFVCGLVLWSLLCTHKRIRRALELQQTGIGTIHTKQVFPDMDGFYCLLKERGGNLKSKGMVSFVRTSLGRP